MTPTPTPDGLAGANQHILGTNGAFSAEERKKKEEMEALRAELRVDKFFGFDIHQFNRLWYVIIHACFVYRTYLGWIGQFPDGATFFEFMYGYFGGLGVTMGCHRYWSHKSFKATRPLQITMMIAQTVAFQVIQFKKKTKQLAYGKNMEYYLQHSIYKWCIDHRIHHKYTDTDMDPHNSKRGFWFSQMGWVISPKHPELQKKLRSFSMPDLENDPVVRFQSRWYWQLVLIFHLAVPISVLHYFWELPLLHAFVSCGWRHMISLHFASLVNSAAHMWGNKPYDKRHSASDNRLVSFFAVGEGWHNYHHAFPWDYKAAEFGWRLNVSTMFIDFFAWLGWAYDLKTVSNKSLQDRIIRTGNISNHNNNLKGENKCDPDKPEGPLTSQEAFWGWNDEQLPKELKDITTVLRRRAK